MKKISFPLQMTCLTLAICTQLYAQDEVAGAEAKKSDSQTVSSASKLAPIVTTATRTAKSISDIAGTVYSIDRVEIEKQANAGKSTADILGILVPSLTPSSGTTSNYGMTMRGRVVQYMIDGVPQTGYRDGSRQLNSISPAMIERIEVVSGASSIYGSGATGGIINIITKKGGDDPLNFETKLGVTSGGNIKSDAMAYEVSQIMSFNQGALRGTLGASYATRGEIQDSRGRRIGPEVAQTDRQDTDTLDLNGRVNWAITDTQNLSIGAQYYNDEQDSKFGPDYGPNLNVLLNKAKPSLLAVEGLQLERQPQTERYSFNTQYDNSDILGHSLNAEAYYRNELARYFPSVSGLVHPKISPTNLIYQSEADVEVWGARLALQKDLNINRRKLDLTYGVDYENETDKANIRKYDLNQFIQSNGLNYKPENRYSFGPDVETNKLSFFVQSHLELTDRIGLQAGIRHERVESDVSRSTPYTEQIVSDLVNYDALQLNSGKVKHDATLFNIGGVYHLTDAQQIFANFSQGSNLPDVQRMLRDVPANFVVNSQNIDPIKVNSYEVGWRTHSEQGLNAGITTFYNDSDKNLKFGRPNFTIEVNDTDERVYGVEGNLSHKVSSMWTLGGTVAYTRGQFKNTQGKWQELDAIRVAPIKGTLFSEWQFDNDMSLRVQALAVAGTNKASEDAKSFNLNVTEDVQRIIPPAEIKGFATMDVIANAKAGPGHVGFGVYNVWNTDYKSVYSQSVAPVYGAISSLAAQGRTYGLSYSLKY